MPMICTHCGNTKTFRKEYSYRQYGSGCMEINGEDEEPDYDTDEKNCDDEETDDETYYCKDCDKDDVEFVDDEKGILKVQMKHTDEKGKWWPDELPEAEWNKELKEELLLEGI